MASAASKAEAATLMSDWEREWRRGMVSSLSPYKPDRGANQMQKEASKQESKQQARKADAKNTRQVKVPWQRAGRGEGEWGEDEGESGEWHREFSRGSLASLANAPALGKG